MIPDLKIYHGRKIEKTYHAEEIDLQFGVVEDIIDALDLDSLQGNDAGAIIAAIVKAKNQIRRLSWCRVLNRHSYPDIEKET